MVPKRQNSTKQFRWTIWNETTPLWSIKTRLSIGIWDICSCSEEFKSVRTSSHKHWLAVRRSRVRSSSAPPIKSTTYSHSSNSQRQQKGNSPKNFSFRPFLPQFARNCNFAANYHSLLNSKMSERFSLYSFHQVPIKYILSQVNYWKHYSFSNGLI